MADKIEALMQAADAYASTLPDTSMDAPFVRSHRKGLSRAIAKALLQQMSDDIAARGSGTVHGWCRMWLRDQAAEMDIELKEHEPA